MLPLDSVVFLSYRVSRGDQPDFQILVGPDLVLDFSERPVLILESLVQG